MSNMNCNGKNKQQYIQYGKEVSKHDSYHVDRQDLCITYLQIYYRFVIIHSQLINPYYYTLFHFAYFQYIEQMFLKKFK